MRITAALNSGLVKLCEFWKSLSVELCCPLSSFAAKYRESSTFMTRNLVK